MGSSSSRCRNIEKSSDGDGGGGRRSLPLPEEIVSEILVRLPVKSLCALKCVSTVLRSTVDNPRFASVHIAESSAPLQLLVSVDEYVVDESERIFHPNLLSALVVKMTGKFLFSAEYPRNSENSSQVARICSRIDACGHYISQSGGLICTSRSDDSIQVCNPATGECVVFPEPLPDCSKAFLGYDPVDNKYTIFVSSGAFGEDRDITRAIHILTLGEKEWTRINPDGPFLRLSDGVCIDGIMYMAAEYETNNRAGAYKASLLVFDVRRGSYRVITFPEDCKYNFTIRLINYRGCAAILDYRSVMERDGRPSVFRMWILKDLPGQIWSYREFIPSPPLIEALANGRKCYNGFTRAGELVFSHMKSRMKSVEPWDLYLYHLEDATIRKIEISGLQQVVTAVDDVHGSDISVFECAENAQSLKEFRINQDDATTPIVN